MSGAPTDPRCGTYAGVQVHTRDQTPRCDLCKLANADYIRAYRRRRGDTGSVLVPLALLRQIEVEVGPTLAAQVRSLTAETSGTRCQGG